MDFIGKNWAGHTLSDGPLLAHNLFVHRWRGIWGVLSPESSVESTESWALSPYSWTKGRAYLKRKRKCTAQQWPIRGVNKCIKGNVDKSRENLFPVQLSRQCRTHFYLQEQNQKSLKANRKFRCKFNKNCNISSTQRTRKKRELVLVGSKSICCVRLALWTQVENPSTPTKAIKSHGAETCRQKTAKKKTNKTMYIYISYDKISADLPKRLS